MAESLKSPSAPPNTVPPPLVAPSGKAGIYAPQRDVHLFDRLAVVVKYYKVVAAVFVLVVAGMMYQAYTTIPMYMARARIQIQEESTANATAELREPFVAYQDPEPFYNTQYKILQGRDLARRAVRKLTLATVPEFNGRGPTPPKLKLIVDGIKARVLQPFGAPATPSTVPAGQIDEETLISAFLGRVGVNPVKGSRLVDVTFTSADPQFAAK